MPERGVWAWAEATGAVVPAHREHLGLHLDRAVGRFDPLVDPEATDGLAREFAGALGHTGAESLIVGEGHGNAVLGFAVARYLGIGCLEVADDEGVLVASHPRRSATRYAVVMVDQDPRTAEVAVAYASAQGAEIVAIVAGVASTDWPHKALARMADRGVPPDRCGACEAGVPLTNGADRGAWR